MVTYNDKILIPNATKDALDTIHPETNTGNVYDFVNNGWLSDTLGSIKTDLITHESKIASTTELGHLKVDGTTIKVDPVTGIISADGMLVKEYNTGHLDDLKETGFYTSNGATIARGFPRDANELYRILIEVFKTGDGWILQRFRVWANTPVESYERGMYLNIWHTWRMLPVGLNNTLTSESTSEAATANTVRLLNDKLLRGSGSPEGNISAPIGTIYVNDVGGNTTTLYVKTSGMGNTGWTAK